LKKEPEKNLPVNFLLGRLNIGTVFTHHFQKNCKPPEGPQKNKRDKKYKKQKRKSTKSRREKT